MAISSMVNWHALLDTPNCTRTRYQTDYVSSHPLWFLEFIRLITSVYYLPTIRLRVEARLDRCLKTMPEVHSLLEHSCGILISFKIVFIFNTTSAKSKQSQLMLY